MTAAKRQAWVLALPSYLTLSLEVQGELPMQLDGPAPKVVK